jgi:hypothetical protein
LDESCREESNKFKEAGGAQDDLSHEEDDDGDDDDDLDDKVSNTALVAVTAGRD